MSQLSTFSCSSHQRGFTLLELLVCLSVMMGLLSLGSRYLQYRLDANVNQVTAHHLKQVTHAATQYVQDHYQKCSDNPPLLTIKDLVDAGYLTAATAEKNNRRQQYGIKIAPEGTGKVARLQVLITTHGGDQIDEKNLRGIANLAGANAGYISVLSPEKITGTQESWVLEGHDVSVEVGHLAALNLVNQTDVMDAGSFLRRIKIEGHPEYNKMETDLQIADDNKIFFREDQMGMQLSQYRLSSTRGSNRIVVSNQKIPEIVVEDSIATLKLNPYVIELHSNTGFAATISPLNIKLNLRENYSSTINYDKIVIDDKINKEQAKLTADTLSLHSKNGATIMTSEVVQVKDSRYKMSIDKNKVVAIDENYDSHNWNIDKEISQMRSQLDQTGVRLPYHFFNKKLTEKDYYEYGIIICGSEAAKHTDESGKLFIMSGEELEPRLYVCDRGIGWRVHFRLI